MGQPIEVVLHLRMVAPVAVFFLMMMRNRRFIFMAVLAMNSVAMIERDDSRHTSTVTLESPSHPKHLRPEHCESAEHKKKSLH